MISISPSLIHPVKFPEIKSKLQSYALWHNPIICIILLARILRQLIKKIIIRIIDSDGSLVFAQYYVQPPHPFLIPSLYSREILINVLKLTIFLASLYSSWKKKYPTECFFSNLHIRVFTRGKMEYCVVS